MNTEMIRDRMHSRSVLSRLPRTFWVDPYPTRIILGDSCGKRRKEFAAELRKAGYSVHEANSAFDVLRKAGFSLKSRKLLEAPDLIIVSDSLMDMSGIEVAEHIRQVDWAIPIVVLQSPDRTLGKEKNRTGIVDAFVEVKSPPELINNVKGFIESWSE